MVHKSLADSSDEIAGGSNGIGYVVSRALIKTGEFLATHWNHLAWKVGLKDEKPVERYRFTPESVPDTFFGGFEKGRKTHLQDIEEARKNSPIATEAAGIVASMTAPKLGKAAGPGASVRTTMRIETGRSILTNAVSGAAGVDGEEESRLKGAAWGAFSGWLIQKLAYFKMGKYYFFVPKKTKSEAGYTGGKEAITRINEERKKKKEEKINESPLRRN